MSKKTLGIVLLALIGLLVVLGALAGKGQGRSGSFVVDRNTADRMMSARTPAEGLFPDIYFDEEKLFLDETSGTYFYSLVEGSPTAYEPKIKAVAAGGLSGAGEKNFRPTVYFIDETITDGLIASNTPIEMLICDDENYLKCQLICTTLPLMSLEVPEGIGDLDAEMEMTLFDNEEDSVMRLVSSGGTVRIRGGLSREFAKNSYRLSLRTESIGNSKRANNISLLGMRKDDDWILNCLYNDHEKVRNTLSHNLWTDSCGTDNVYNVETGVKYKYLELFVNGEYRGLYALGYKPDEKTMNSQALKANEGIYKKEFYHVVGFETDYLQEPIFDYYTRIEENANDPEQLKKLIDWDNILDFNLFMNLVQGTDNMEHNYYVLLKDTGDGPKGIYIPWDLDLCWGFEWSEFAIANTGYYVVPPYENILFIDDPLTQLMADCDKETYSRLCKKYHELRADGWSDETINKMIDEYQDDIFGSGAYYRDCAKWPGGCCVEGLTSLDTFRDYVNQRLSYMDSYIERLETGLTDNQFINQSYKYENWNESLVGIEINDKSYLEDPEYLEFFEYMGIDPAGVTDDIKYIVCDPGVKKVEYIDSSFAPGDCLDGELGRITLERCDGRGYDYDEDNSLCIDGKHLLMTSPIDVKPLTVSVLYGDRAVEMYMKSSYKVKAKPEMIPSMDIWLRYLDNLEGKVLLRVNDTKSADIDPDTFLSQFDLDLAGYGSVAQALEDNEELAFLLDDEALMGALIKDPFVNGTYVETPLGSYAYFEGDSGYGIYIDGAESVTGSFDEEHATADIRVFNEDWTEQTDQYVLD